MPSPGMRPGFPLPDLTWEPARPFWEAAARDELRLPRCAACSAWAWYPHDRCEACGSDAPLDWVALSGRATLYSWVVVHHAWLPEYRGLLPFVTGIVVPEETVGAARLVTRVVDADPAALAGDMPVRLVFRDLTFTGVDGSVRAPCFTPRRPA